MVAGVLNEFSFSTHKRDSHDEDFFFNCAFPD